jgi:hypothetical protein
MVASAKNWFEVDARGFAKLWERRGGPGGGKMALLTELVANAWDAPGVTRVDISLVAIPGAARARVTVTDDAPGGFEDLSHAWTMFAESTRKRDPEARGRFDLGEKVALALCEQATITTTTGAVRFGPEGRTTSRARRDRGSEFSGVARISRAELAEIRIELKRLISPRGIDTVVDGVRLPTRAPIAEIEATLPTEVEDGEGVLRRSARRCRVLIYEPLPGETPSLYELGIPVVETGDRWHVLVEQKIPLTMERDNVTPSYLRRIRTLVVNHMHERLVEADAGSALVAEALADDDASPEAVRRAVELRYGEKRAIWDPSDPEANMNLVAQGYNLIRGGQLTADQWSNVKKHGAALPAGRISPTKKALFSADGKDCWVPEERWTPAMRHVVSYANRVCSALLERPGVLTSILCDVTLDWSACFGQMGLVFNLGRLGHAFFDECARGPTRRLNRLLVHEVGHGMPGGDNHLDDRYHQGLCELAARLAELALAQPEIFRWEPEAEGGPR